MRIVILGISTLASAVLLNGCATVVNGSHQDVAFSTVPEGSAVKVFGGPNCVTPCKMKLLRKNSVRVDVTQAGYKPAYVLMRSKAGGATFGNVLAGGLIGVVVDASNGSNNFLSPDPLKLRLAAEGSADEPKLIDKNGKEELLSAQNDSVRGDVARTIGNDAAGMVLPNAPAVTPAPAAPAPAAPAPSAPAAAPAPAAVPAPAAPAPATN